LKYLRDLMGDPRTFSGVVAFDEAHNAKNLIPGRGKASKTGQHIKLLQDDFVNARIVYASATGASEIRNMGYMTRLGLWVKGTPFSDFAKVPPGESFPAFLPELKKGGIGAMELVGMDLKAQGRYLCRTLSFRGASFTVSEARLDTQKERLYDAAAALWRRLIVICKNGKFWAPVGGINLKTFWAAQQLFFRQLLCAFKVDHTIGLIQEALDRGRSVIVGVQLTGDSRVQEMLKLLMKDAVASGQNGVQDDHDDDTGDVNGNCSGHTQTGKRAKVTSTRRGISGVGQLEDAFSSTQETFVRLIENCWASFTNVALGAVQEIRRCAADIAGVLTKYGYEATDRQCRRHKLWQDMVERAEALKFPVNPIDGILQHFGSSLVAEVTGRRLRAEMRENGKVEYVSRAASAGLTQARLNLAEQNAFVKAEKRVIIISQAGSSGISLHASCDFPNQQPRTHIILELPWSSEQLIQQCGRSHRSNQLSAPEFIAISTNVAGETRFAMSVAARMQSLGAITKSDRRAAHCTSKALSRFNYATGYGRNALRELQSSTQIQALARLASVTERNRSQAESLGTSGLVHGTDPTKRQHFALLGLRDSATSKEMREKFIGIGVLHFVEWQMANREVKAYTSANVQGHIRRGAEMDRNAAARRLLEAKTAYEAISGQRSVPMRWDSEQVCAISTADSFDPC
jgi:hypothetical protein